jgi:hypothetical protein
MFSDVGACGCPLYLSPSTFLCWNLSLGLDCYRFLSKLKLLQFGPFCGLVLLEPGEDLLLF